MVFSRKADDRLASLVRSLDKMLAADESGEHRVVIHLIGEERDALMKEAESFSKKAGLKKVPVTVPKDFQDGPKNWSVNPDAELTVFMYHKKKVTHNHALKKGKFGEKQVKAVLKDAEELFGL